MAQYIDKDALVAEIKALISGIEVSQKAGMIKKRDADKKILLFKSVLTLIDTLKVKEVDEKFERPTIKVKDDVSVSSRMQYIDDELKPIAEFIMKYASWNLHKEEWNHPVLEVPLFRVLDALIQRGKPYCEG